jgi:chemotaxis protein CheC
MIHGKLDQQQQDQLSRIVRQGMVQAAEMLARLLQQPVNVEVSDIRIAARPAEQRTSGTSLGVYVGFHGEIKGGLLLLLPEGCSCWLSQQLLGLEQVADLLAEPVCSTLKEIGNILTSSFLASLDDQLELRALPEPPQLSLATADEILEEYFPGGGKAGLVVQNRLWGGAADRLQGVIFLSAEPGAAEKLLALNSGA